MFYSTQSLFIMYWENILPLQVILWPVLHLCSGQPHIASTFPHQITSKVKRLRWQNNKHTYNIQTRFGELSCKKNKIQTIAIHVMLCICAENSSGVKGKDRSLCVSLRFLARVCSLCISVVKLDGNQPHWRSLSLSPSYQPEVDNISSQTITYLH